MNLQATLISQLSDQQAQLLAGGGSGCWETVDTFCGKNWGQTLQYLKGLGWQSPSDWNAVANPGNFDGCEKVYEDCDTRVKIVADGNGYKVYLQEKEDHS